MNPDIGAVLWQGITSSKSEITNFGLGCQCLFSCFVCFAYFNYRSCYVFFSIFFICFFHFYTRTVHFSLIINFSHHCISCLTCWCPMTIIFYKDIAIFIYCVIFNFDFYLSWLYVFSYTYDKVAFLIIRPFCHVIVLFIKAFYGWDYFDR